MTEEGIELEDEVELDEIEESTESEEKTSSTDRIIEQQYQTGRLRVIQDRNDFFLPHVADFINGRKWGNIRPEYQRRLRWDVTKKSRLIESFLMNVPVPPVFLYETSLGRYEVMDGQQRLSTIVSFLANEFALDGLKIWPALNTRTFARLPPLLRRGLERAKISAITLMADESSAENDMDLRAQVFDRLNTGGEKLNHQELRNCLYSGPFNQMLFRLAAWKPFTDAWGIPAHSENTLSDDSITDALRDNKLYATMSDCQIVLRFFAFRDIEKISGSTKRMLDKCMEENRNLSSSEIEVSEHRFREVFQLATDIFGSSAFRLPPSADGRRSLSRPLYDAQMVALDRQFSQGSALRAKADEIRAAVDVVCRPQSATYETIVGRPNTARAIRARIAAIESAILSAL